MAVSISAGVSHARRTERGQGRGRGCKSQSVRGHKERVVFSPPRWAPAVKPRMVRVSLFVKLGVSWSHTSAASLGHSATTQEPPAKHAAKEKLIGRRTLTRCGVSRRHSGKIPV